MLRYIHKDIRLVIYKLTHEFNTKSLLDEFENKWQKFFNETDLVYIKNCVRKAQYRKIGSEEKGFVSKFVFKLNFDVCRNMPYDTLPKLPSRYRYTCIKSDFFE